MRTQQIFKMGGMWRKRFLNPKKLQQGWTFKVLKNGQEEILEPCGKVFGTFNTISGELVTTQNIMSVQW